jgi:hypothetical protein
MEHTRTGGMITIGVLNLIFGGFRTLGALLTILAGGGIAALGAAASHNGGEGGQVAAAGGAIIGFGVFSLIIGATLFVAGIGVLRVAPWGRTLSLAAASLAVVSTLGQAVFMDAFGIGTFIGLIYPGVLFFLFFQPDWKVAFSGDLAPAATISEQTQDDFRQAA